MNTNKTDDFIDKLNSMSLDEILNYQRALTFLNFICNLLGVSSVLLMLLFMESTLIFFIAGFAFLFLILFSSIFDKFKMIINDRIKYLRGDN